MKNKHRYHPAWNAELRPLILARDKFKCTECHIKQRAYGYYDQSGSFIECDSFMAAWAKDHGFKVKRIWLQVVHKDQNPENNAESNLATMCPRCHFAFDNKFNRVKKLAKKSPK